MEILGHRGSPTPSTPENTLAAVTAALAGGADGVELDVRLTSDDVAVCCHDGSLERVAGVRRGIRSLTLADLGAIRVQGHRLPTVADVVQMLPPDRILLLDLKPEQRPHRLLVSVLAALGTHTRERVVLSSFDERVLDTAARVAPELPRAVILRDGVPFSQALSRALRRGDSAMHLPLRTVFDTPELVQTAHRHGLTVRVWTVNRTVDARLLDVLAVDGVISDVPGALAAALRPRAGAHAAQ